MKRQLAPGCTEETMRAELEAWLATRPPIVRELAAQVPVDTIYRLRTTGQLVTIVAYAENGTVRVHVDPDLNWWQFCPLSVYGILPEDLVPAGPIAPGVLWRDPKPEN